MTDKHTPESGQGSCPCDPCARMNARLRHPSNRNNRAAILQAAKKAPRQRDRRTAS